MKLKRIQQPNSKRIVVKMTEEEFEQIKERARLYTEGNASFWIRYAATKHKPRAEDLEFEHQETE